jgi:uncharacterized membrane-anchored protein YjiN (DUF445 family)
VEWAVDWAEEWAPCRWGRIVAVTFLEPSPADLARRAGLRRMRVVATSLLALAAVVYVVTLPAADGGWGYVNTAAEAAMVGALADWFAVTALFKHPLGLPIPHTALVKRRKDELGRSLEQFVTENFLTEEIARERLEAAEVGTRVGVWLSDARHREFVLSEAVRGGRAALHRTRDEEVRGFVEDVFLPRLVKEPLSPIAGALLEGVIADGAHHGLVDLGLEQLHDWLIENPEIFREVMADRAPWWTPPWVDERVITWSYQQVVTWLQDVRTDADHPARVALDDLLGRLASDLQTDPEVMERAEALKTRLLTHPQVGETVVSVWQSVRTSLLSAMDDRSSMLWARGEAWLAELGERLVVDHDFRRSLEGHLGDAVAFFIATYADEVATIISATVDRWDGTEASKRIELFVGRDLQFIRINGTIVGALAGLTIHAASELIT